MRFPISLLSLPLLLAPLMATAKLSFQYPVQQRNLTAANGTQPAPSTPPSFTAPTQEFFQFSSKATVARSGPVHILPLQSDPATGACRAPAATAANNNNTALLLNTSTNGVAESIIVAEWAEAEHCGLRTLTQLVDAAVQYNATLAPAGLLPSRTLVILLSYKYDGTPINPLVEPYLSHDLHVPDGTPADGFYVALVDGASTRELLDTVQRLGPAAERIVLAIDPEAGPWNELFQSVWTRVFTQCLSALVALCIIFSAYRLVQVVVRRDFLWNVRNVIFLVGFVGTTLYSVTLQLRMQVFASKVIEIVAGWLNSIAFHALLYLWSVFAMQVRHHRSIRWLRWFIAFGALCTVFFFVFSLVLFTQPASETLEVMSVVVGYWMPTMQALLALVFLVYVFVFRRSLQSLEMSSAASAALLRLQVLAMIAFATYLAIGVTNLRIVTTRMNHPQAVLSVVLLRQVANCVRGIALIAVLGVRMPERRTQWSTVGPESKLECTVVASVGAAGRGCHSDSDNSDYAKTEGPVQRV